MLNLLSAAFLPGIVVQISHRYLVAPGTSSCSTRDDGYCHVCHDMSSQTLEFGQLLFLVSSELNPTPRTFLCLAPPGHILPKSCLGGYTSFIYTQVYLECFLSVSFINMNIFGVISHFKLKTYLLYSLLAHLPPSPCSSIPVCKSPLSALVSQ